MENLRFSDINIRSAINGVPIPRDILLDTRRFSTERHFDVREVLTNYDRYRKGTLEFFCDIFGVNSPKNGIDGSKVGDYFKQGRLEEIANYCLADCKATGELYQRLKNYYRSAARSLYNYEYGASLEFAPSASAGSVLATLLIFSKHAFVLPRDRFWRFFCLWCVRRNPVLV
jgi:hypothetical protein